MQKLIDLSFINFHNLRNFIYESFPTISAVFHLGIYSSFTLHYTDVTITHHMSMSGLRKQVKLHANYHIRFLVFCRMYDICNMYVKITMHLMKSSFMSLYYNFCSQILITERDMEFFLKLFKHPSYNLQFTLFIFR